MGQSICHDRMPPAPYRARNEITKLFARRTKRITTVSRAPTELCPSFYSELSSELEIQASKVPAYLRLPNIERVLSTYGSSKSSTSISFASLKSVTGYRVYSVVGKELGVYAIRGTIRSKMRITKFRGREILDFNVPIIKFRTVKSIFTVNESFSVLSG